MSKYRFFSKITSDEEFVKACHDVAMNVLGDSYSEEITDKTAKGILENQEGDYDQKIGIFRNGIKGFSNTDSELERILKMIAGIDPQVFDQIPETQWVKFDRYHNTDRRAAELIESAVSQALDPKFLKNLISQIQSVSDNTGTEISMYVDYADSLYGFLKSKGNSIHSNTSDNRYFSQEDIEDQAFSQKVTPKDLMEFNFYIKGKLKTPALRKKFKDDAAYEDFMMQYQEKSLSRTFSALPVDTDPAVLDKGKISDRHGMPKVEVPQVTADWSLSRPFNISIEPWLIANVINDKADGLYMGELIGDQISASGTELRLDIKLSDSTAMEVFVLVKSGKAIIYKTSQLCKSGTKSFSVNDQAYGFDINPTATVYDMEHLIGSWMMAASVAHLFHICDQKYAGHMALDEFYKNFPEKIDALAEHYLADKANAYFQVCITPAGCPIDYLTRLVEFTKMFEQMSTKIPSAYQSQIDDIINQAQSTLYKLKRLDTGRKFFSLKK